MTLIQLNIDDMGIVADGAVLPTEDMGLARDMAVPIDCGTNLADLLSNALPPDKRSHDKDKQLSDSSVSFYIFFDYNHPINTPN